MKNELKFFLAASLALGACSPIAKVDGKTDNSKPEDKTFVPTNTPIPPTPVPTEARVYNIPGATIPPTHEARTFLPYPYFSQLSFGKELTEDKSKLSDVGCGMADGAMVTRTSPDAYIQLFNKYFASIGKYGPARITRNGSDVLDHMAVLDWLGYRIEKLSIEGSTPDSIKDGVEETVKKGGIVWIRSNIYNRAKGHQTLAIGTIIIDGKREIVANDPLYGQSVVIPDSEIDEENWDVFSILPPGN